MITESKKNELLNLIIETYDNFIGQIVRIEKNAEFDYVFHLKSSGNLADFVTRNEQYLKYLHKNEYYEAKEKQQQFLLNTLLAIKDTLTIIDEQLYSQLHKKALKEIKNSDDYKHYIIGYKVLIKDKFAKTTKITKHTDKYFWCFNKLNIQDQIFKLQVKIKKFYFYTNNRSIIYFVTDNNEVITVTKEKNVKPEMFIFDKEQGKVDYTTCLESEISYNVNDNNIIELCNE